MNEDGDCTTAEDGIMTWYPSVERIPFHFAGPVKSGIFLPADIISHTRPALMRNHLQRNILCISRLNSGVKLYYMLRAACMECNVCPVPSPPTLPLPHNPSYSLEMHYSLEKNTESFKILKG